MNASSSEHHRAQPSLARKATSTPHQASPYQGSRTVNQTFQFAALLKPSGILLEITQAALNFAGLREQEVIGQPFWQVSWWMSSQQVREAVSRAAQGELVRTETEVQGVNRSVKIELVLKPLFDGENIVTLFCEGDAQDLQVQAALKSSEERWQLLQATEDGLFDWNIATNEVIYSPQFKEMLGGGEIINGFEVWRSRLHPDDRERVLAKVADYLERRTDQYVVEYRLHCKDGSYRWILSRGQAQWDQAGKPLRLVGSNFDISDRKRNEAEVLRLNRELEQRISRRTAQLEVAKSEIELYKDIVENMQFGLCVWRLENLNDLNSFRLVAANPAAARILNITIEECVGQRIQEFANTLSSFHCKAIEDYGEIVRSQQCKDLGEVYYDDARSGEVFTIKAFPLPNQSVGVAFDNITERKRTEGALAASERQYRTVVNSVKEIIFQTDTAGCWTFLNPAWTEITGFELEESLHNALSDYIYAEEDQQHCWEQLRALMTGQQDFFQYEFRLLTQSGNFRWLEIEAQVYHSEEGTVLGTCGTINDTTERKQTEAVLQSRADELTRINTVLLATAAQLEKRNQELDQFAYVTSHDLKAPLRAIANLSQWIEEDLEDRLDDDTQHQMRLLRGRVHRMEALINGLLEYSRVGRVENEPEEIAVGSLLNEVIDSISPPQAFTIEIEEMPTLKTKRLLLQQVFANLISNAIKHHDRSSGKVRISVEDRGPYYEFAVTDDGPGIAPEYQEKVFVIFQTLEARDKAENTGIGLSIVKKIVENQGGKIQLRSQLGQGTTFSFTWLK